MERQGFSLIEVIVALALLAAVLLTISGLFIQGGQSVNTGRDLTEATSLATSILEHMDKWAFAQLYTNFCKASTDAAFTFTTSPTPTCAFFDTNAASNICGAAETPPTGCTATGWQTEINKRLPNAKASIEVTPLGTSNSHFDTAKGIRVKVTVDWTLKSRTRQVALETVRF